ncbi:MAG: hypothetical protein COB38_12025 [Gammaproteobacteria bacterium]|nr:MAG: hypothetical protein COB38_12025 [Gammaproteobacteria bacterium]
MFRLLGGVFFILSSLLSVVEANEFEVRGNFEVQGRFFYEDALFATQHDQQLSVAAAPEFFWSWNDGDDSFEFVPSARVDQYDSERTHIDIREFSWVHVGDDWETRIGIRREFWGVTEFQHLVDIINQSDSVEDVDNEDKLGQPMINLSLVRDWGIVDIYLLPYFRERTFAGAEGRPGIPFVNNDPLYESADKEKHLDFAIRWAHTIDDFDLALSWFEGTNRSPNLLPTVTNQGSLELTPYYNQIKQLGIEFQASLESSLLKLEVIHNENNLEDYWALQGGFEYSQYGIFQSNADLGWLIEYAWDERGTDSNSNFQNDLFFGNRLALNDIQSTEILFGFSYDLDFNSTSVLVEASRRFGDSVKVSLDARFFESNEIRDPLFLFRRDDHIQITAQYYY